MKILAFLICYLVFSLAFLLKGYQDRRNPIDYPILYGGVHLCDETESPVKELVKFIFFSYDIGCRLGEEK